MGRIFYFTSTGNSLYVSKKIDEKVECELCSISNLLKSEDFECEDDFVGIVYPLHSYGLPILVEDYLKKLKIKEDAYVFAVQVTGGHSSSYGFKQIQDILKLKGCKLSNFEEIKYISNYTRAGRNPSEERAVGSIASQEDKLNIFIDEIKDKKIKEKQFGSNFIYSSVYKMWKNGFKHKDRGFNVNKECIGCNMCQVVCPTDNIVISEGNVKWMGKCVDCMACINICPVQAINIGKKTQTKDRYKNPYINTRELL